MLGVVVMRQMWRVLPLFVVIATVIGCVRDFQIYNVRSHAVPQAAQVLPLSEIRDVIMRAGVDRGWTSEEVGPGQLVSTLLVRTHTAIVDIEYSLKEYSITYKHSVNLRYTGSTIHRNYNKWIMKYEQDIERDLQKKALDNR